MRSCSLRWAGLGLLREQAPVLATLGSREGTTDEITNRYRRTASIGLRECGVVRWEGS